MKNTALAALVLWLFVMIMSSGCGWPDPPAYYSIDPEFSLEQQETIRDVFDSWCGAVGYCPTEAKLWADRGRVILVDDLPEDDYTRRHCPEGRTCHTAGTNDGGDVILVARERPLADDLGALWFDVAHEVGHYCVENHTKKGLMSSVAPDDFKLEIDDEAVKAWKDGCG